MLLTNVYSPFTHCNPIAPFFRLHLNSENAPLHICPVHTVYGGLSVQRWQHLSGRAENRNLPLNNHKSRPQQF